MKYSWFVAYEADRQKGICHYRRWTKSFATEEEAKAFARDLIDGGTERITAGTINPVRPKRIFSSMEEIIPWLGS